METRRIRDKLLLAALASVLTSSSPPARAADAWILGFHTEPVHYGGEPDCESLRWHDKLYLLNSNPTAASVSLLGISNGSLNPSAQNITIPANSLFAASVAEAPFNWLSCAFPCPVTVFVAHLDIPEGVFASSRAEVVTSLVVPPDTVCPLDFKARVFAGLPLPVKRQMTPAGRPQYHLGIDAGSATAAESGPAADARTNIGIYNQALVMANATIETRRGCDGLLIERRTVTIPANSVAQFNGLSSDTSGCGANLKAPIHTAYAVVMVDQPSFSYAISLRNDMPPYFAGTAPVTQ